MWVRGQHQFRDVDMSGTFQGAHLAIDAQVGHRPHLVGTEQPGVGPLRQHVAQLVVLDARSGKVEGQCALSGVPDVIFFNPARRQLYVAVGDPGVIDVLDTATMKRLGSVPTEKGAHTLAFAPADDRVYAFLPQTHRAAVYQ